MNRYQLIALDVDGTLLTDDHELTEATRSAVRQAHEAGATIVLCTGRGPGNAIPVLEELGLEGTVITHNGSATVRSSDRAVVHSFPFDPQDLDYFIRYCNEHRLHYDVSTPRDLHIFYDLPEEGYALYEKFLITPIRLEHVGALAEQPVKFTVFSEDPAELDRVEAAWREVDSPLLVLRSGEQFIDVMHPEASKGNALRVLADSLGIDRTQVLAMGNYFNDLDMLRFAGFGIAMDNSPEEVKRAADEVTLSNNEDGVAAALRRHCQ
ncbi:Cof-type HAD-IIB family hydrolase [Paenibacillus koleovorans]|uniref:Cof-type HAD-IIB family hydrolase n=1 Tax=Paenibacillus koleovorans TaxID=121608 RepID=UPI000FDC0696|nr:Cof-type HAD-IIB family hydrolase [Paenibacillus koleovorans]